MRFLTRLVCAAWLLVALPAHASETHVVAAGQTLGRIADRYNVTIAALCEANGLKRKAPLKIGLKLRIPEGTDAVVGEPTDAPDSADSDSAATTAAGKPKADGSEPKLEPKVKADDDRSDTLLP